jgi:Fur family ferric uptake transcriptional regulator
MTADISRRKTQQRKVVLEELQKLTSHPTALELYEIVRRRLPNISLATVYRNLEFLAQTKMIQKLESAGSKARFDYDVSSHHHVRCTRCGRVDDIHGLPADLVGNEVKKHTTYKILGHRLEFLGICPECEQAPKDGAGKDVS